MHQENPLWDDEPVIEESSTEWVSISDLMSGLLLIFALLVVATLYQLKQIQEESQNKRIIVVQALKQQFDANGINAEVNPETGDITLLDSVLFDHDDDELKEDGKEFLTKFLPVYIGVIFLNESISEEITRIIIEGHTSSDGSAGYNMHLSLERANAVFQHINDMDVGNRNSEFIEKIQVAGRGKVDSDSGAVVDSDRKVIFRCNSGRKMNSIVSEG